MEHLVLIIPDLDKWVELCMKHGIDKQIKAHFHYRVGEIELIILMKRQISDF